MTAALFSSATARPGGIDVPGSHLAAIWPVPLVRTGSGTERAGATFIWPAGRTLAFSFARELEGELAWVDASGQLRTGGTAELLDLYLFAVEGSYSSAPQLGVARRPEDVQTFRLTDTQRGFNLLRYRAHALLRWPDGHSEQRSLELVVRVNNATSGIAR